MLLFTVAKSNAQQNDGFTKLPSGLAYQIIKDVPGDKIKIGEVALLNIEVKIGDTTVYNSKKMNGDKPIKQPITASKSAVDLMEGFAMMSKGDVALFRAAGDLAFPNAAQRPPFMKDGDFLFWKAELVDIQTQAQADAEAKAAAAKAKAEADAALAKEPAILKAYLAKNKLKAKPSPTGTYVVVSKQGNGAVCEKGNKVKMRYTGYLLDGTVFDSNVDPKFGHPQPFEFPVGQGRVIPGWDNSILGMKVGTKAKLIIPSANAYGARATPGNANNPKGIPANSPLVFDIEVLSVN